MIAFLHLYGSPKGAFKGMLKNKKIPGNDVQSRIANSFRSILKYSVFGIPFSHKTARQEPTIYGFGVLVLLYKVFLRK